MSEKKEENFLLLNKYMSSEKNLSIRFNLVLGSCSCCYYYYYIIYIYLLII
jgi:hypothetical protein